MAKTECIIEIMKENEYIEVNQVNAKFADVPIKTIEIINIHNRKVKEEIKEKINEKIKNDNEYIIADLYTNGRIDFCSRYDVEEIIKRFIRSNEETTYISNITQRIRIWINEKYENIEAHEGGRNQTILINTKIRKERKEEEKKNDERALELLNDIL